MLTTAFNECKRLRTPENSGKRRKSIAVSETRVPDTSISQRSSSTDSGQVSLTMEHFSFLGNGSEIAHNQEIMKSREFRKKIEAERKPLKLEQNDSD